MVSHVIAMLMIPIFSRCSPRTITWSRPQSHHDLQISQHGWKKKPHLQLNFSKTELLVIPASPSIQQEINIQLESTQLKPTKSARNLGVMIDDQLTFKAHVASVARSCRFVLYNIRKIRPLLSEHAARLLVQALPTRIVKPLKIIRNAAERLVFNHPKKACHPTVQIASLASSCCPLNSHSGLHSLQLTMLGQQKAPGPTTTTRPVYS